MYQFEEVRVIGRDLIRLIDENKKFPEYEVIWKDLLHKPNTFSPTLTNITDLLSVRTPPKYFASRLTPDMEAQLMFILKNVRFPDQISTATEAHPSIVYHVQRTGENGQPEAISDMVHAEVHARHRQRDSSAGSHPLHLLQLSPSEPRPLLRHRASLGNHRLATQVHQGTVLHITFLMATAALFSSINLDVCS